ncbi:hypothetical protein [Polaribacter sp.]|uniref:hypothetical protein n=1 Tax=Polaribacter sp. TaxID=1920175 RepID=UPI003F6D0FE3
MKKVVLSLVFALIFICGTEAVNKNKSEADINSEPDMEACYEFASEMAGIIAIWNNNSFQEEDDDLIYFMSLCMEQPF